MPLEIRELIIRTEIFSQPGKQEKNGRQKEETDARTLVDLCVERVLKKLKRERGR